VEYKEKSDAEAAGGSSSREEERRGSRAGVGIARNDRIKKATAERPGPGGRGVVGPLPENSKNESMRASKWNYNPIVRHQIPFGKTATNFIRVKLDRRVLRRRGMKGTSRKKQRWSVSSVDSAKVPKKDDRRTVIGRKTARAEGQERGERFHMPSPKSKELPPGQGGGGPQEKMRNRPGWTRGERKEVSLERLIASSRGDRGGDLYWA